MKGRAGERYVAHVLPLIAGEKRRAGAASNAVAALFVRKAELEAEPPSEVIGKTYKLTPTELRVLRAIVNVGGVRQVAGNLGVADTTIKTISAACSKRRASAGKPISLSSSPAIPVSLSTETRIKS